MHKVENEVRYINDLINHYKITEKITFRNEILTIILGFISTAVIIYLSLLNKKISRLEIFFVLLLILNLISYSIRVLNSKQKFNSTMEKFIEYKNSYIEINIKEMNLANKPIKQTTEENNNG